LATVQGMQGNWQQDLDALHKALTLLEVKKDTPQMAADAFTLAGLLSTGQGHWTEMGNMDILQKRWSFTSNLAIVSSQVK
jgi:hypothetical protein